MERRLIFAIALSILIMAGWSFIFNKPQPVVNDVVVKVSPSAETSDSTFPAAPAAPSAVEPGTGQLYTFTTDLFDIVFIENRAAIKEIQFKDHKAYTFSLGGGLLLGDGSWQFERRQTTANAITFVHSDANKTITKTFELDKHIIKLRITVKNSSESSLRIPMPLTIGSIGTAASNPEATYYDVTIAADDKTAHYPLKKKHQAAGIKYMAFRDRYYCVLVQSDAGSLKGVINPVEKEKTDIVLVSDDILLEPRGQIGQSATIYVGPQDVQLLTSLRSDWTADWTAVVHYGFFDVVSQVLLQTLGFIHKIVRNWGVAVILLSILIYLVLFPLSIKQMRSMKEMQALQPKIEAIRVTHKDNPQRLNKEIMELYRRHKVNPIGGCLPLVLQMPIFFALYQALMRSLQLRGAHFLWIKDLSQSDKLFVLPSALPFIGNEINLLPVLMSVGMFIQQKTTAKATSGGSSAEQQKIMLIIFPIMFCFIFYHMPSALVLYWFVNSILMLIFQARINRT